MHKNKRRERTVKIDGKSVRQYEVRPHFRRFPGKPRPSWIVVDKAAGPSVLREIHPTGRHIWTTDLGAPNLFLRKTIVQAFGQDGKRDPRYIFLKTF